MGRNKREKQAFCLLNVLRGADFMGKYSYHSLEGERQGGRKGRRQGGENGRNEEGGERKCLKEFSYLKLFVW